MDQNELLRYVDRDEIVMIAGASMGVFTGYARARR